VAIPSRYQRRPPGRASRRRSRQTLPIAAETAPLAADDSPHAIAVRFAAAINNGDVAAALELWLEDASLVQADGTTIQGREAIAPVLQALIDNRIAFQVELARVFLAGDLALCTGTLTMSGRNGHGEEFRQASSSVVVYARDRDGRWRIAVDAPWGLPGGAG
jgi:uncharacterized protein (TIGR02246 family)